MKVPPKVRKALAKKLERDAIEELASARAAIDELRKEAKKDDPDRDILRGYALDVLSALDRESAIGNVLYDLEQGE